MNKDKLCEQSALINRCKNAFEAGYKCECKHLEEGRYRRRDEKLTGGIGVK